MAYNTKCPGCDVVRDVAKLEGRTDGTVRCRQCGANFTMAMWTAHTNSPPNVPANPLPAGTYVAWGLKTKEKRDTGLLRTIMEGQSGMRPGATARKGGGDYTKLPDGTSAVRIYIAKDEVLLRGQYYAGAGNGPATGLCVLLLNGSGASIGHYMAAAIAGYQAWGAAVLAVDYRGIGKSTGRGTSHGLYTDADAMLDYLIGDQSLNGRGWAADRVVVHGFSLGSGPATELAVRHSAGVDRVGGLVLHCPFASFGSAAAFKSGNNWVVGKIASWGVGYDNIHKVLHTNLPLHVVYARDDTFVNPQDGANIAGVNRGAAVTTKQEYRGDHTDCDRMFNNGYNVVANTTGTLDGFVTGLPRN
jgi:hypothetical protein